MSPNAHRLSSQLLQRQGRHPLAGAAATLLLATAAFTLGGCSLFMEPEDSHGTDVVSRPATQSPQPAPSAAGRPTEISPAPAPVAPTPGIAPTPIAPPPPASTRHYQLGPATNALVTQAHAASTKGDYLTAMSTLERAVRIEPRNPLVWIEMSKIRLASGEAVQAESVARKAVAFSEGDQRTSNDAWKQVALALRAQNRNPEAAAAEARASRPFTDGN